jgi:hypothetical protein
MIILPSKPCVDLLCVLLLLLLFLLVAVLSCYLYVILWCRLHCLRVESVLGWACCYYYY